MESLSRSNSNENYNVSEDGANQRSGILPGQSPGVSGNIVSRSFSANSIGPAPPRIKSRTTSHSLLSPSIISSASSRKGRSTNSDTSDGDVGRASISMPPPATNNSAVYKPSVSRRRSIFSDKGGLSETESTMNGTAENKPGGTPSSSDLERVGNTADAQESPVAGSPSILADHDNALLSSKSLVTSSDVEDKRLSISSLFSLGSTIYSGIGGSAAPSTAGSHPGSMKGYTERPMPASPPTFPVIGNNRVEISSIATTATDPVSVTTVSTSQYPGAGILPPHSLAPKDDTSQVPFHTSPQATQLYHGSAAASSRHSDPLVVGQSSRITQTARRSRSRTQRRISASTIASSASPNSERDGASKERDRTCSCCRHETNF